MLYTTKVMVVLVYNTYCDIYFKKIFKETGNFVLKENYFHVHNCKEIMYYMCEYPLY